jgi:predicted nucleic acid-binding protein
MKYYFDTSVWLAYFNKDEPYHKEALLWFDKIRKEKHELYISALVDDEMRNKRPFREYLALSRSLCKYVLFSEDIKKEAKSYSGPLGFDWKDIAHILIAKKNELTAVTIDMEHWMKIARELNFWVLYIADIYLL